MRKYYKYVSLVGAIYFAILATLGLIVGQLGPGLMNLIFAIYFMFDYKQFTLEERIERLEQLEKLLNLVVTKK